MSSSLLILGVLLAGMTIVLIAFCRSRLTTVSGSTNRLAQEIRQEVSSGDKELGQAVKRLNAETQGMQERLEAIQANTARLADRIANLEKEAAENRWW